MFQSVLLISFDGIIEVPHELYFHLAPQLQEIFIRHLLVQHITEIFFI